MEVILVYTLVKPNTSTEVIIKYLTLQSYLLFILPLPSNHF